MEVGVIGGVVRQGEGEVEMLEVGVVVGRGDRRVTAVMGQVGVGAGVAIGVAEEEDEPRKT